MHEVYCTASSAVVVGISCPCHSIVQVTCGLPVKLGRQARLLIVRLTIPCLLEVMTAYCRSVVHRVAITISPPAQVHERSHVEPNLWSHSMLHCISFDELALRDCHGSRPSDRDGVPPSCSFRLAVCMGDALVGSLGRIAYRSRYLLREALHCCSCQCSRAFLLSW